MSICEEIIQVIKNILPQVLDLRGEKTLKADNSFVSKGDLLMESEIKKYLEKQLPDFALISEESPEGNMSAYHKQKVIILDPIDGTENFVSGLKEWGVAFCIYENGNHIESLLALPELNLYLKSGDKFKQTFNSRIAGISSSLTKEDILKLPIGYEYRIIGCCVYNMYNVVAGSYYSFENPKGAKVWDILPGLNLALEHNLKVTINNKEYHGELLRPDQSYIFRIEQK